jgi:hypothetical protein
MPKQSNGFDHQQCKFIPSVAFVVLSHLNENFLTLPKRWCTELSAFLNKCWFLSFQMTQVQASQMSCRKDRRARSPPTEEVNWTKCSGRAWASTAEKPIHDRTSPHNEAKVLHEINICWAVMMPPQPVTQRWASGEMMPRATKFDFVGSRSRRRRHAKMETFKGTCLCHTRSSAVPNGAGSWDVKSW